MNKSLKSVCDPLQQLSNLRSGGFFVCHEFKIIKLVVFVVVDWTAGVGTPNSLTCHGMQYDKT